MSRDDLTRLYTTWRAAQRRRQIAGVRAVVDDLHSRWVERPNRYVELDLGTKQVRYPDGKRRSVRARQVRDTAGVRFVVLDDKTPLFS